MKGYWHSAAAAAATPARFLAAIHESPWRGALEPAPECTTPRACRVVQGAVPETLRGTLYRNGAGRLRVGTAQYAHWFDGDGYVVSVTFRGANHPPLFRARYVRTRRLELQDGWDESNRAGFASRGGWTQREDGSLLRNGCRIPTNPANTNTLFLRGRLFALCEGGVCFPWDGYL